MSVEHLIDYGPWVKACAIENKKLNQFFIKQRYVCRTKTTI